MQIINKTIDQLTPYEYNPRNNEQAVQYVAKSIEEFGFKVPLVIDSAGVIVAGHTRYKAAMALGLTEVPCIVADDLTPEQIKAFRLADNKTGEFALWDDELLKKELDELMDDFDMSDFGFLDEELEDGQEPEVVDDDYEPEPPEPPKSRKGDIYQLGRHRLIMTRCGDNGIFKGVPMTAEEKELSRIARSIYSQVPYDGKYIIDGKRLIICQSHTLTEFTEEGYETVVNPLGFWTGGINVDTGATNRKLGSDMGLSVTGGGLHGKDLSKADVSVNIHAWRKAQWTGQTVELCCAIGDETVDGIPYEDIVEEARRFIEMLGGFEQFAEWGLI